MAKISLLVEPDPDDAECATVQVAVEVDRERHWFVLDTGAARTSVVGVDQFAELTVVDSHESSGVFGPIHQDVVRIASLTCGPIVVTGLDVVRNVAASGRSHLLGMDVLSGWALRFDGDAAVLDLRPSGAWPVDLDLDQSVRGHPFVAVEWAGATGRACWDTGAGITVVDRAWHAAHSELFTPAGRATGTDSTGATMETDLFRAAPCQIGGVAFAAHKVAVTDLPQKNGRMDLVLGWPALRQAVWTFDFPLKRWSVTAR